MLHEITKLLINVNSEILDLYKAFETFLVQPNSMPAKSCVNIRFRMNAPRFLFLMSASLRTGDVAILFPMCR